MRGNKPLAVRLRPEIHEALAVKASTAGMTPSEYARQLIEADVATKASMAAARQRAERAQAAVGARAKSVPKRKLSVVPDQKRPCQHGIKPGFWCNLCRKRI